MHTRWLIAISLIGMLLAACTYRVLPSLAMQVQIHQGESPRDVLSAVQPYLMQHGYLREGRGGYDEIKGTDTVVSFGSSDKVDIALGLDRTNYVPIRVTYNDRELRTEATTVFTALRSKLSARWEVKNVP